MLTKAQYRTMTRQYLDDPDAKRWTDGNIDLAIQLVIDDLWTDMLDQSGYLTTQLHVITALTSPGYIDLRLTTNGGQLTQRFYRVQSVKNAAVTFYPSDPRDTFYGTQDDTVVAGSPASYTVRGDQLWLSDTSTSFATAPIDFRYSFKPTPFTALTDGTGVPFPEGGESAAVLAAAASTMAKGNAEDARQLFVMAEQSRIRLLASIRRQYHGMMVPWATGSGQEWGGG